MREEPKKKLLDYPGLTERLRALDDTSDDYSDEKPKLGKATRELLTDWREYRKNLKHHLNRPVTTAPFILEGMSRVTREPNGATAAIAHTRTTQTLTQAVPGDYREQIVMFNASSGPLTFTFGSYVLPNISTTAYPARLPHSRDDVPADPEPTHWYPVLPGAEVTSAQFRAGLQATLFPNGAQLPVVGFRFAETVSRIDVWNPDSPPVIGNENTSVGWGWEEQLFEAASDPQWKRVWVHAEGRAAGQPLGAFTVKIRQMWRASTYLPQAKELASRAVVPTPTSRRMVESWRTAAASALSSGGAGVIYHAEGTVTVYAPNVLPAAL